MYQNVDVQTNQRINKYYKSVIHRTKQLHCEKQEEADAEKSVTPLAGNSEVYIPARCTWTVTYLHKDCGSPY